MSVKPTEATLAYTLWVMLQDDDGLCIREITERATVVERIQPCINELIARGHMVFNARFKQYFLTEEGRQWVEANRSLVADAVLDSARQRVPSFIFNLGKKPTKATKEKS